MTYTYDLNTDGVLIIHADAQDQKRLRRLWESADRDGTAESEVERKALQPIVKRKAGGLWWVRPETIGALTDAPILGLRKRGRVYAAWGFMDYQVRCFVDDLIETGQAVFTS